MDHTGNTRLVQAAGILDAEGVSCAPGALLIEFAEDSPCILAAGRPGDVENHPRAAGAARLDLPDAVLIPGLVNAHTHLDLTHIGPRPYDPVRGRFGDWLAMILRERAANNEQIEASVRLGVERSIAGGVCAVGDIAGVWSTVPTTTLRRSPLTGVSYIEAFGAGARQEASADRLAEVLRSVEPMAGGVRAGLTPHAPYTVGLRLYERALALATAGGAPLATHLAESEPEHEFIGEGTGLFRELLESMSLWDDSILDEVGKGATPVEHLVNRLKDRIRAAAGAHAPVLLVHCNDVSDRDLDLLASVDASVAYCPRSSAYFGAERRFGPHRYADMLDRGINVALGTDSIVNLPKRPDGSDPTISTLDEMRFLFRRDGDSGGRVPPMRLLAMATTNGARALGMDPARFSFAAGPVAGVLAIDVGNATIVEGEIAGAVLRSSGDPALIAGPSMAVPDAGRR